MGFLEMLSTYKAQQAIEKTNAKQALEATQEATRQAHAAELETLANQQAAAKKFAIECGLLDKAKPREEKVAKPQTPEEIAAGKEPEYETVIQNPEDLGIITRVIMLHTVKDDNGKKKQEFLKRRNKYGKIPGDAHPKTIVTHNPEDFVMVFEFGTNPVGSIKQAFVFGVVVTPCGDISFQALGKGSSKLTKDQWRQNPSLVEEGFGKAYLSPKLIEYSGNDVIK